MSAVVCISSAFILISKLVVPELAANLWMSFIIGVSTGIVWAILEKKFRFDRKIANFTICRRECPYPYEPIRKEEIGEPTIIANHPNFPGDMVISQTFDYRARCQLCGKIHRVEITSLKTR